ncbi:MAG: hypothetical protein KDD73_16085, partial [Anaerolineales bacterium]|nr:hypothetical protein [Anaerolineales bacterium]
SEQQRQSGETILDLCPCTMHHAPCTFRHAAKSGMRSEHALSEEKCSALPALRCRSALPFGVVL